MFLSGRRPSQLTRSGWEALPDDREWFVGPPGCPEVVERPFRMFGSGREALPDDREWSGDSHGCPKVVGRPSRMFVSPSRMSGSGW